VAIHRRDPTTDQHGSFDLLPSSPLPCLFSLPFSPLSYPLSYLPSVLKWDVD